MKILVILFSLFFSVDALAQGYPTLPNDSIKPIRIVGYREPKKSENPLIVVDGKKYRKKLNRLDTSKVLSFQVLKAEQARPLFGDKGKYGVLVIVTKGYAKKMYQRKFVSFSKAYKAYMSENNYDDSRINYWAFGGTDIKHLKPGSVELYNVSQKEILKVEFSRKESIDSIVNTAIITTNN